MKALGGIGATLLGLVVLAALVFGGWQLGWWFNYQNAQRQGKLLNIESHNLRTSYANQQSLREQITANIGNVLSITPQIVEDPAAAPALKAQRAAVVSIVCQDAAQVMGDPLDPEQSSFIAANCYAGSISPSSQYNVN